MNDKNRYLRDVFKMKRPCGLRPTGYLLTLLLLWVGVVWASVPTGRWVTVQSDQRDAVRQMVKTEVNRELEQNKNAYTVPVQGDANLRAVEVEKAALDLSYRDGVDAAEQTFRAAKKQRDSHTALYQTASADLEDLQKQVGYIQTSMENLESSIARWRQDIRAQEESFTKWLKTEKQGEAVVAIIYLKGPRDAIHELNRQADIAAMPLMAAQMGTFIKSFTKVVNNTVVLDSIRAVEEGTATPTRDEPPQIVLDAGPKGTVYLRLKRFELYPFQSPATGHVKGAGVRTIQASIVASSQALNTFLSEQGYDSKRFPLDKAVALIQEADRGNAAAEAGLKERTQELQEKIATLNGKIQDARRQQEGQQPEKARKERELGAQKKKVGELTVQKDRAESAFVQSQATLQEKKRVRESIIVKNALTPPKGGETGEDAAIETMIDKYDEVKGEARTQHSRAATTVENFQVTDMTDTRAVTEARITGLRLIAFLNEADNGVRVKVAFRVRTVLSADADGQRQPASAPPAVSLEKITVRKTASPPAVATKTSDVYRDSNTGETYPSRPLEIVAPSNPGGSWDAMARILNRTFEAEKLYSQSISVLNKPGGGGAVAMAYMKMNNGNDYKIVVFSPPLIINSTTKVLPYHYTTLIPLAKLSTDYQVFIVKADSPYKTFNDLMAAVKKNPGAVKFAGGSSPGSMDHLAFCEVAKADGINPKYLSYVAFQGVSEALVSLLGGHVAFVSSGINEVLTHIQAGTVRALAITSDKRRGGPLKNVPTLQELGINTTYEVWRGVFGAPGMSGEAQAFWATTLRKMIGTKTWKELLEKVQWIDAYADANGFDKFLKEEENSYLELMTDLGFVK